LHALYPDTSLLLIAYYKDKALKFKEGTYTFYYPKNKKAREGYYYNNQMNGIWRFWYENGTLKDSGKIVNEYAVGNWKSWHPNGPLMTDCNFEENPFSDQNKLLAFTSLQNGYPFNSIHTGTYKSWYANGQLDSSGSFLRN
jgi:uncharacterized protein